MEVKRRLVYIADENEDAIAGLCGTPLSGRPTRQTMLRISSSKSRSSGKERQSDSNPIDRNLLVSLGDFVLADNGVLNTPRSAEDALLLLRLLAECREFLKPHANVDDDSSTSVSSSSLYEEEEDGEESSSSDGSVAYRRKRTTRAKKPEITVSALKEELRKHNLPVTGNKETLKRRLEEHLASIAPCSPQPRPPRQSSEKRSDRGEGSVASSFGESEHSPVSRASTQSRGIWGALVDVGSRIFRRTAGAEEFAPSSRKRQRSTSTQD
ncbi:hypothetical protein AGDE_09923 [Angomonas deanei]|uniref:SAP domain containing protein, putative n=1 Tax=Angomonas deanei TaxID=59799 RepID=A0A7G2C5Q0_9TRYP|nr:hypothetical protein AGDE_09923 [Angomonas deanei]CAD2214083.1 SAP domain containing protein, putative [Angomonas deanei]|eukprot:EPY29688.1 hypothetical protein AGDE_09923 [Angomonas deanei]